jgi:LCP family protein required for cell wall assembly
MRTTSHATQTGRRRRRLYATLVLAPVLCGMFAASTVTAAWLALGSPTPAAGAVWMQVVKTGQAGYTGAPGQPFFVLALGTGARSDNPADSPDDPGLSDAIHVIGVNPAQNTATILDIPRDTEGPGGAKINSYILSGGSENLRAAANAISTIVGVPLPYVIRVNFPHFVAMVNAIGGIDVDNPAPMDDDFSGAHFPAGPLHLDGDSALAFARDRHSFANGDLTRTSNQGLLIISALADLEKKAPSAGDTVRLVATLGQHVKLDGIGISDLFYMGRMAFTVNPATIKNVVLPVGAGPGSDLVVSSTAKDLLADFADDAVLENH